jgi:transcriptional regulator of arginine metabolism
MPSATLEQNERRRAIARLLEEHAVNRQAELVELLRAEGFPATQSSVSRDLRDLGAAKLKNGYSLPKAAEVGNAESLQVVAEFVREIRPAGPNLLSSPRWSAQLNAWRLDGIGWPEIGRHALRRRHDLRGHRARINNAAQGRLRQHLHPKRHRHDGSTR